MSTRPTPVLTPDRPVPASPAYSGIPAGTNYGAYPGEQPNYTQGFTPDMWLAPEIQKRLDAIAMDPRGLSKYREEALRTGPSAWATLSKQNQKLQASASKQKMRRELSGNVAGAESALAMRGGLTSGARERVAKSGNRDFLDMSQNLERQRGLNDVQIDVNDEQNRISQLGALPGMEVAAMQPEFEKTRLYGQARQADNAGRANDIQQFNSWNQNAWNKKMEAWGTNRTAQATENAGK